MSVPATTGNSDDLQIAVQLTSTHVQLTQHSEPPIQRLHPELFNEIFRYCLDDFIYDYPSGEGRRLPRPSVKEPPLILCRICRRWRQLVLANPLLWAQIELYGECRSSHLVALDEWLIRSQQSPLHLSVSCYRYEGTSGPEFEVQVHRVVAKLIPHAWRWKHVFFALPTACARPIVERLGEGSDNLEILKICDTGSSQGNESLTIDLSGHKVLSKLQMDDRIHFIPTHSPMNNIRILRVSFSTIDEYLHCLDVCPSASDIGFIFNDNFHFQPSAYQPMRILPSVTALNLQTSDFGDRPHSLGKFLALLQVPNMRELCLSLSDKSPEEWKHTFDLINRSNPPLTSFTAYGPIADSHFFQCLRHMSLLETLTTSDSTFEEERLNTLIDRPKPGQSYTCPKLQTIYLSGMSLHQRVLSDLATLVLHRWYSSKMESDSPSRISTVKLCTVYPARDGRPFLNYPGMRQCIKDGLQVCFLGRYFQPVNPDSGYYSD